MLKISIQATAANLHEISKFETSSTSANWQVGIGAHLTQC